MKAHLLVSVLVVLMTASALAATPGEVEVGELLREAPLYGFAGDFRQLSELRGKPLLINVWASWCRAEMGSLERLSRRYGGKQFNIIGISTDDDPNALVDAKGRVVQKVRGSREWDSQESLELIGKALRVKM